MSLKYYPQYQAQGYVLLPSYTYSLLDSITRIPRPCLPSNIIVELNHLWYNRRGNGPCKERIEFKPYEPLVDLDVLRSTLEAAIALGEIGS